MVIQLIGGTQATPQYCNGDTSLEGQETFGQWLRRARRERDITREALAELISCATPTLTKIEQGTRRPSRELATLLIDALQVPADERDSLLRLARQPLPEPEPYANNQASAQAPPDHSGRALPDLPTAPTSMVGRADEQATLRQLLGDPACRLITIVGPGGIGKTRLALQIATEIATALPHGAAWVDLAPLSAAEHVLPAVAAAVGCALSGVEAAEARLLGFLHQRRMLLVIDNAEHLLDATALFGAILRQAPGVTLLVTSRQRLRLQGEWVVELHGLGFPDDRDRRPETRDKQQVTARSPRLQPPLSSLSSPELERYDAVLLFLLRARQVNHAFTLTPENRAAVARICRLLEGMPLGIELAAAWIGMLSAPEIADELARSLDLLNLSARDTPPRHRNMRTVFEHSWQLLSTEEQHVLAALAVFRGGFRREAAQAVAGSSLATLARLADASLIGVVREAGSISRYTLHELVRQYAAEHLAADPAAQQQARARHAAYYAEMLASSQPGLQNDAQSATLAALDAERDNIRQTWAWLIEAGDYEQLRRVSFSLLLTYELRNRLRESTALFSQAVARLRAANAHDPTPNVTQNLGVLLTWEGWARGRCGEVTLACERLEEAAGLLSENEELLATTGTLGFLGMYLFQLGRYAEARAAIERNLALLQERGLVFLRGLNTTYLTYVANAEGQAGEARALAQSAIAIAETSGSQRARVLTRCVAAMVANDYGDIDQAEQLARAALHLGANSHDLYGCAAALFHLGRAAVVRGELDEARYLLGESQDTFEQIGDDWNLARVLMWRGALEAHAGASKAARQAWRAALRLARAGPFAPIALRILLDRATLRGGGQTQATSYSLLAAIARHPAAEASVRARAAQLCDALTPEQRQAAEIEARRHSLDELAAHLDR
jgi:predicted ATPase/transcriptional regulator with XRE-family HTH domain